MSALNPRDETEYKNKTAGQNINKFVLFLSTPTIRVLLSARRRGKKKEGGWKRSKKSLTNIPVYPSLAFPKEVFKIDFFQYNTHFFYKQKRGGKGKQLGAKGLRKHEGDLQLFTATFHRF